MVATLGGLFGVGLVGLLRVVVWWGSRAGATTRLSGVVGLLQVGWWWWKCGWCRVVDTGWWGQYDPSDHPTWILRNMTKEPSNVDTTDTATQQCVLLLPVACYSEISPSNPDRSVANVFCASTQCREERGRAGRKGEYCLCGFVEFSAGVIS